MGRGLELRLEEPSGAGGVGAADILDERGLAGRIGAPSCSHVRCDGQPSHEPVSSRPVGNRKATARIRTGRVVGSTAPNGVDLVGT